MQGLLFLIWSIIKLRWLLWPQNFHSVLSSVPIPKPFQFLSTTTYLRNRPTANSPVTVNWSHTELSHWHLAIAEPCYFPLAETKTPVNPVV
jgi:hypothetical protein